MQGLTISTVLRASAGQSKSRRRKRAGRKRCESKRNHEENINSALALIMKSSQQGIRKLNALSHLHLDGLGLQTLDDAKQEEVGRTVVVTCSS